MEDYDGTFAANVRGARESKALSQRALASLVNSTSNNHLQFTQQTVARIESGARAVSVGEALHLARALSWTIDGMLGLDDRFWADIDPRDRIEGAIRELEARARSRSE
jgi:transcriptional regulator with XRE-family HTH domain